MRWWRERTLGEQVYLVAGLLLFSLIVALFVAGVPSSTWDFRNNLWGPTHLLLNGLSPYRIDQLFEGSNSVWLPTALGAFLPLGSLPLSQASMLWSIASLAALVMCVVAAARMEKPYPLWLMVALLASFLFPPTVSHFQWGQFTLIALLLSLCAADMLERGWKLWAVALALVLSATKPQVVLLLGVGVAVWVLRVHGFLGVVRLALWGIAWAALLIAPLFLLFPAWIDGLIWAFERNPGWLHPSSLVLLRQWLGDTGVIVWGALLAAALIVTVMLWLRIRPTLAVIWTMALTLLVTPYVWSYDFVLLLPLMVFTLFQVQRLLTRLLWVAAYSLMWWQFFDLRLNSTNSDEIFWWVPWAVFVMVGACWLLDALMRWGRSARPQPKPA
ncbi:hypothetical protein CEN41_01615 [Fischerella thermalis CCMEE 5330]|uniref:DUF2029 domain-containing protein n=1 Tax=Fischerella thermalis CCMEE 5330 TaxID=2019670 RepID=A0A2N6MNG1_9CYAN|nr:hypothetical protein CEN41_01615 [Fischerella thermalis CCMEE 5330]